MNDELKRQFEKVEQAISSDRHHWREKLMELGFDFSDDEDIEAEEERLAKIENERQAHLANYFEGTTPPNFTILHTFLAEKNAENPNFPLIRRYFKKANKQLKNLLCFGLKHHPTNTDLLNDLSFYNEFCLNLTELVAYYKLACANETDIDAFKTLASDFDNAVNHHHYDAYHALLIDDTIDETKKNCVRQLQNEENYHQKTILF